MKNIWLLTLEFYLPGVPQNVDVFRSLIIPSLHIPKLKSRLYIHSKELFISILSYFNVSFTIQKNIIQFQISTIKRIDIIYHIIFLPVDNAFVMQIEKTNCNFGWIKTKKKTNFFIQGLFLNLNPTHEGHIDYLNIRLLSVFLIRNLFLNDFSMRKPSV
jgi:hypothetical protein